SADVDFHQMFEQVPTKPPYNTDPTGKLQVRNYLDMLNLFDHIITTAPEFVNNDFVGFPINAILNWPMGTPAGQAAFANPSVNIHFKKMFDTWSHFLTSYDSTYVLTTADNGWFGSSASAVMPNFSETYICDPSDPNGHYGFKSWDDFFTRGTIYQAFLSAISYHRWHSPVNGVVKKIVMIPGCILPCISFHGIRQPQMGLISSAQTDSQGFITHTATRALIFIESSNQNIGLVCMVMVGMAEVSMLVKGQEIGMFHFGGLTYCLIFRPQTNVNFEVKEGDSVLLNAKIATVGAAENLY
ncbi:hypothetical protein BT96DRAFT_917897, partial [Gymnopus androsaceus JB14]